MPVGIRMMAVALTAAMFAATMPVAASASVDPISAENQFVDLINQERTSRGLKPLATQSELVIAARRQAAAIRDAGRLFHTIDLGSVTTGWKKLGENVGYGGSVNGLHLALMNSPGHRANILDTAYTHVGLGVVVSGTTIWVAQVFMQSTAPISQSTFTPPFRDDDGLVYEQDIMALAAAGITTGCAPERFCPSAPVTRAEMATFLQRAFGLSAPSISFFWDTAFSPHHSAINAIAQASISTGCGGGRYCPNASVSRGEMATFLTRALNLPPASRDFFRDDTGSPHEAAINSIAAAGITTGCGTGKFCPTAGVTRAEMASFLVRALDL